MVISSVGSEIYYGKNLLPDKGWEAHISRHWNQEKLRASKGKAIRYLHYKWNIPLNHILVSGDSKNDEDMLRGEMLAVVVGNHHPELEKLRGQRHIYFAEGQYAAGILEGFQHYRFLT